MNKPKKVFTERVSTHFLRIVVFMMGAIAVLLSYLILPEINAGWAQAYPDVADWKYPFLILLTTTTVPFFIALYQTLRLLKYIDQQKAFSELSVKALKNITLCAIAFSVLYAASLPFIYRVADNVDAPGLIVIGLFMCFAPLVIAVFAAVLQKLLQSAIDIKNENDLTV
jgi:hypothetical protein